jgi:hypothetical protein
MGDGYLGDSLASWTSHCEGGGVSTSVVCDLEVEMKR